MTTKPFVSTNLDYIRITAFVTKDVPLNVDVEIDESGILSYATLDLDRLTLHFDEEGANRMLVALQELQTKAGFAAPRMEPVR